MYEYLLLLCVWKKLLKKKKKNEKGLYTYNISAWDYIGVTFTNYDYAFTTLKKKI